MTEFENDINMDEVQQFANVLAKTKPFLTPKLLADLEALYRNPKGFPFEVDARNRPQGPTIRSCSLIGAATFKALGEKPKGYTMNVIGCCVEVDGEWRWAMRRHVHIALERLGWFDKAGSVPEQSRASPSSDLAAHEREFEERVAAALKDTSAERQSRLINAPQFPEVVPRTSFVPVRNPDVVAEVTLRANGKCELCQQLAPFRRAKDGSPYLEVHHKIRLSDHGPDTVENAIAVCPNCHRKLHYGSPTPLHWIDPAAPAL
jgi:5-methylcytosine-specific restriction endonuclease McrA